MSVSQRDLSPLNWIEDMQSQNTIQYRVSIDSHPRNIPGARLLTMEANRKKEGHCLGKLVQIKIKKALKGNRAKGAHTDGKWHFRDKNLFSVSSTAKEVAGGQRKL